jgi:hypothetical protein
MSFCKFKESWFTLTHLFIWPKTILLSFWNWEILGLLISTLMSSANKIEVALPAVAFGNWYIKETIMGPKSSPVVPHILF